MLCVYTMLYENAPDRARIEKVIDGAMHGHVRLAGSTTDERERIIQVCNLRFRSGIRGTF